MNPLDLDTTRKYIESNIWPKFHALKLKKINSITLDSIIKRKNPYLFRAKNTLTADEYIRSVLDATISSGEETTFGNFMEDIAIHICGQVFGGRKSGIKGLDLEFEDGETKYLVSIKSGPNWGNSGQITQMLTNFTTAKKTLATSGGKKNQNFICIEGCCYGTEVAANRGTHFKYCGQEFWELISGGNKNLYKDLIEPIGHKAEEHNEEIHKSVSAKLNLLTKDFINKYCDSDGNVLWDELIEFNSGKK